MAILSYYLWCVHIIDFGNKHERLSNKRTFWFCRPRNCNTIRLGKDNKGYCKRKKLRGIEKVVFSDYRLGSLYVFHSGDFKLM